MVSIKTNFSFIKAFNKIKSIEQAALSELPEAVAETATSLIKSGKVEPDILQKTKDFKEAKGSPTPNTPLMDTGNLVNTMKVVKDGIQFAEYGIYHQEGIGNKRRKFLPFSKGMSSFEDIEGYEFKRNFEIITNRYVERIRKAMKK